MTKGARKSSLLLYELYAKKCGLDIMLDGKSDLHLTKFLEQVLKSLVYQGFLALFSSNIFPKKQTFSMCQKNYSVSFRAFLAKKHSTEDIKNP